MDMDLNADLGEGCADDAALLEVVSSASVACGGHAGDRFTMHATCDAARRRRVSIGAHPSYEDHDNFGRLSVEVSPDELSRLVIRQLRALATEAVRVGSRISYVKPHGALYHDVCSQPATAEAFLAAVSSFAPGLPVLGLPGSHLLRLAPECGLQPTAEGFADRGYLADGTLAPRSAPGAVLTDPELVAEQALSLATNAQVRCIDGTTIDMRVESICLHGDTPGAVRLAGAVRSALETSGIRLRAFA